MLKKVILMAFIVAGLCMMAGPASAVGTGSQIDGLFTPTGNPTFMFVNPGGLGDALIYGYYNVRDGKVSVFGLVNTDETFGARVRIRFREAADVPASANRDCDGDHVEDPQGSHEVLDFDICLSPGDMWTGRIISDASGAATLKSDDTDTFVQFTDQALTGSDIFPTRFPNGVQFKFGTANTVSAITADNTREGYFEVIAERQLTDRALCSRLSGCGTGTNLPCCTCGDMIDIVGSDVDNVLFGANYIVDLGDASTFGYNATAIAEFTDLDVTQPIASARPNLREDSDENLTTGITPVNYILTKSDLFSVHDTENSKGGDTELIVTFPTKKLTQDENGSDCDDIFIDPTVVIAVWDDKEKFSRQVCEFSPCPQSENSLPFEVNVLDLNASNIFTTQVETELNVPDFRLGWVNIDLVAAGAPVPPIPAHQTTIGAFLTRGLPAIGYNVLGFGVGAPLGATHMNPMQYDSNVTID
jgi:hypothetical protein